jgi:hemerythrin-like domain-containing protein
MKCTNLLELDHKVILRALNVLEEMAGRIERNESVARRDIEALVNFLRVFGDDYHQTKEESALFPELRRSTAVENKEVRHMLFEHEQERSLVEGLEESVETKHGRDFVHYANRLIGLLRNHIYKEDNILFGIVENCLTDEQDATVVAEFANFERGLEGGTGCGCLEVLHRLEWDYLKKRSA